jgi:hypothetical protein
VKDGSRPSQIFIQLSPIERMTRAGFPPTRVFGGTFLVTTEPAATTEFSPIVTPPMIVAPVSLNRDGLSDRGVPAPRRLEGMARRDDADVRPNHHIVRDFEPAKVIESAVLIYEDIMPDADFVSAGSIDWRDQ